MSAATEPGFEAKHAWGTVRRIEPPKRLVAERCADFREPYGRYDEATVRAQGSRCLLCPEALCVSGCPPLENRIPEWLGLNQMTSGPGGFGGGDLVRGPYLLVHAVRAGRKAAFAIHRYLLARKNR